MRDGKPDTLKGKFIKYYIAQYPHLPAFELSQLIWEDHPEFYKDIVDVRYLVRHHLGCRKNKNYDREYK